MADVERISEPVFKIGDLVRLKSGGPEMTVFMVQDNTRFDLPVYDVCWFVGGDLHRDGFSEPELMAVLEPLPYKDPSKAMTELMDGVFEAQRMVDDDLRGR